MHKSRACVLFLLLLFLGGCLADDAVHEESTEIELYFMRATQTSFELASESRELKGPESELSELMRALLSGPRDPELSSVIPEDVQLLDSYIQDQVAYLDFSAELAEVSLGSESEAVLVDSLVLTALQLDDVRQVQILVEGEIIESLAGHVVIDRPLAAPR
ncbi:MAG: GerMN domain-containing protein [Desulfohalobiaceae bacterium]